MKKLKVSNLLVSALIIALLAGGLTAWASYRKKSVQQPSGSESPKETKGVESSASTKEEDLVSVDLSNVSLPILMYHHIRDYNFERDEIGMNLSVSPKIFAKQLDSIKEKGFTPTTFVQLSKGDSAEKPIILSFDDGYLNFYENAFPELKERQMKAVVFIISDFIGKSGYMNEAQLKEIAQSGIEIGAHSLSHPDLTTISADKAKSEVEQSKSKIESILGYKITSFCYPSGKYNDTVVELVKSAGYQFAVTTDPGVSQFKQSLTLQRHRVNSDTNILPYLK